MAQAATASSSYRVHLQSLQDFARELQVQIDAVSSHAHTLNDPITTAVPLGDFGEAASLRERHAEAVAGMRTLLEKVREAIAFAERVTGTVANSYTRSDDVAGTIIRKGAQA